jgi:hypothetical protein
MIEFRISDFEGLLAVLLVAGCLLRYPFRSKFLRSEFTEEEQDDSGWHEVWT